MEDIDKPFAEPVVVEFDGEFRAVGSAREAADLLASTRWPKRGPRHRDALDTCLKAIDGHRVAAEARREFELAAREAGLV